jgi:hypothetical protein
LIQPFTTKWENGASRTEWCSYNMGNVIANNKGDTDNKIKYENLLRNLKKVRRKKVLLFIAQTEKNNLERYIVKLAIKKNHSFKEWPHILIFIFQ